MLYVPDYLQEIDPSDDQPSRSSMAKYILRLMAEDYSQTYHFVSWSNELPYLLWRDIHGLPQEGALGQIKLSDPEKLLFINLATLADGWWLDVHDKESFVSLAEWKQKCSESTS